MKKTLCILLAILMMFSLFACAEENKEKAEDKDEVIEYTIYSSGTNNGGETNDDGESNEEKVSFKSASELCLLMGIGVSDTVDETVGKTKVFSVDGREFELEYKMTQLNEASLCDNDVILENYSEQDLYQRVGDSGEIQTVLAKYHRNTDRLLSISIIGDIRDKGGSFTNEQAINKAGVILRDLYKDYCDRVLKNYEVSVAGDDKSVRVMYYKQIAGYSSTDRIVISFNRVGELIAVNAGLLGTFDSVEDKITKERIEKAKAVLLDSISKSWTVVSEELVMDIATGVCYLQVSVGNAGDSHQYYINVF